MAAVAVTEREGGGSFASWRDARGPANKNGMSAVKSRKTCCFYRKGGGKDHLSRTYTRGIMT